MQCLTAARPSSWRIYKLRLASLGCVWSTYKVVQIWPGLIFFCNHNWQTLTCTYQSSTYSPNPSRREGGGCGFTLSRSHSCCAVWLVYTQISPGHIWTSLYIPDAFFLTSDAFLNLLQCSKIMYSQILWDYFHTKPSCRFHYFISNPQKLFGLLDLYAFCVP